MLVLLAGLARAAATPSVEPAAWPDDFLPAFREHQLAKGLSGAALEPACRQLSEGLLLCLTLTEAGRRRPVTEGDLLAWGETHEAALSRARELAKAKLPGSFQQKSVPGIAGGYWVRSQGDGFDAGALLLPEQLAAVAGGPVVVAIPDRGAVLFWKPGDPELDRVMAVGVRQAWEAASQPVSDRIYRWDGSRWVVWGRAVAAEDGRTEPPPPAPVPRP